MPVSCKISRQQIKRKKEKEGENEIIGTDGCTGNMMVDCTRKRNSEEIENIGGKKE